MIGRIHSRFIFCLVALLLPVVPVWAQEIAPLNPDFVAWQNSGKSGDGAGFGYIPSPVDWSHLQQPDGLVKADLPASFDLRTEGDVTGIRDQGQCGACWSFAVCGSLESWLVKNQTETRDFSENHMKNTHGFEWDNCYGGSSQIAAAYLTRGSGPLNESDDPYNATTQTHPVPGAQPQKYARSIPEYSYAPGADKTAIKTALMEQGAMAVSMTWNNSRYNGAPTYTYYYTGNGLGLNDYGHMVTLVGWDDSKAVPGAPAGAWICKNSWGTSWGESGYFYISYSDTKALSDVTGFFDQVAPATYNRIYQHDPLGMVGTFGYQQASYWGANVFTAAADGLIQAVGTYATTNNVQYIITVYNSGAVGSGFTNPVATVSGAWTEAGYHVAPLSTPVAITAGQKFTIAVQYTPAVISETVFQLPIERSVTGFANATSQPGESYFSWNGTSYTDFMDSEYSSFNMNLCIKALATETPPTPESHITGTNKLEVGQKLSLRVVANNMVGEVTYQWYKDEAMLDGETNAEFVILACLPESGGKYQVEVTDESKAVYWSSVFVVTVLPEGSLPVSGVAGLAVLALVLGAMGLRHRRMDRN